MGCQASKAAHTQSSSSHHQVGSAISKKGSKTEDDDFFGKVRADQPERLYKLLAKALQTPPTQRNAVYQHILLHCQQEPMAAKWQNPTTKSTPLHLCCRLLDTQTSTSTSTSSSGDCDQLLPILDVLLACHKNASSVKDSAGKIPLHYAIAPSTHFANQPCDWLLRLQFVHSLIQASPSTSTDYLKLNNVVFESGDATGGCSPLYRVLQTLNDDFDSNLTPTTQNAPTVQYVHMIQSAYPFQSSVGNDSDGDKPLGFLYRRFTRQFDISEQFFAGDNSRPEVVQHRKNYKAAAGNTWKLIELLLAPLEDPKAVGQPWGIVHRAVQMETPPDLLRYIVETNAQDLNRVDAQGNLPLHYAAASKPPPHSKAHFPSFYTKYVVDELLYKFPEGASITNAQGQYPLTLAIQAGKQWIGGGIKSLYDAFPQALEQINLEQHPSLTRALSLMEGEEQEQELPKEQPQTQNPPTNTTLDGIIKDNPHDAIMLVQQSQDIAEITTSMWAHEEDAGVQMLGCVAISKLPSSDQMALTAVAAVVNAMKAHPNEMIVQEKACLALRGLASSDGKRELSMVASGAIAAIVGAMQAHVGDPSVQQEACSALAAICEAGGADRATVVASVSGVTAILNAIAAHSNNRGVQMAGLLALKELTQHPQANIPKLPKSQTEPLLVRAQELFPNDCQALVDILLSRM